MMDYVCVDCCLWFWFGREHNRYTYMCICVTLNVDSKWCKWWTCSNCLYSYYRDDCEWRLASRVTKCVTQIWLIGRVRSSQVLIHFFMLLLCAEINQLLNADCMPKVWKLLNMLTHCLLWILNVASNFPISFQQLMWIRYEGHFTN